MSTGALMSPNLLAEIFTRFGTRTERAGDGSLRYPLYNCEATARVPGDGPLAGPVPISILDIGLKGFGFAATVEFPVGCLFTVELKVPGLPLQIWHCRVVGVYSSNDQRFRGGAVFVRLEGLAGAAVDQTTSSTKAN